MLDPIRRIEEVCAKHEFPVGAAALQFSMRDPRITSTICGVSKPERVRADAGMGGVSDPGRSLGGADGAVLRERGPGSVA